MNAMQHRSAWVSAAVLLGVAGTSGATSDALAASHSVKAGGEMHSIPVERIRPQRQGVVYSAVEVERVRPLRTADLLALVAMGVTDGDELCAGSGDPAPTRKNTIPFDRSALVPTGSRWADDRQPTYATATTTQTTSRWGDLVPTPLPAGQGNAPVVATTATPSAAPVATSAPAPVATRTATETATQTSVPEGWPTLTLTAETATPTTGTAATTAAVEQAPAVVATSQPATSAPAQAPSQTQSQTQTNTEIASTNPVRTTGFTTTAAPVATPTTTAATSSNTTTMTRAQRTAQLAAMFPAPEGWGSSSRRRAAPSGWDLVATPLPTDNTASSQAEARPDTTTRAEPTGTMMPIGAASPTTSSPIEIQDEPASEPTAITASAEPTAMSVRTSRPVADIDEATEAVLAELRRKAVSQEAYDRAMRELAARREAGIRSDSGALMAGDSLGVSIARNAGYID